MSTEILGLVAAILFLVLLNGLYVAGEFALIGSRRSQLEMLARQGRISAQRVLAMVSDFRSLDRGVTTLQVGVTAASLALGMYGEHALAARIEPLLAGSEVGSSAGAAAHGLASLISIALLSFLHVAVGEVIPKAIALQNPSRVALLTEGPLRLTGWIARPIVAVLGAASRGILRLLPGGVLGQEGSRTGPAEIEAIIEESGAGGALEARQARILANLLDFEDLPLRKVMVPRNQVAGLPEDASREEARHVVQATRHSRYPVHDGDLDHIIGFVHIKDLMRLDEGEWPPSLREVCRALPHLPETAPCTALLREFRRHRVHMAVALDEHGGTAGIVTLENLVEEIFGEVQDEFDAEEPPIRREGKDTAVALGTCRLDEISDVLGLELEDVHVDTVAGLVLKHLGRMARAGDRVVAAGVVITVESVSGLAIKRVHLRWAKVDAA